MRTSLLLLALATQAPSGLGDPHSPILDVTALKPAPAIVPAGEETHRDLAGAAIRKDLEAIVGFSKADRARGEKAWGRAAAGSSLAGSCAPA